MTHRVISAESFAVVHNHPFNEQTSAGLARMLAHCSATLGNLRKLHWRLLAAKSATP